MMPTRSAGRHTEKLWAWLSRDRYTVEATPIVFLISHRALSTWPSSGAGMTCTKQRQREETLHQLAENEVERRQPACTRGSTVLGTEVPVSKRREGHAGWRLLQWPELQTFCDQSPALQVTGPSRGFRSMVIFVSSHVGFIFPPWAGGGHCCQPGTAPVRQWGSGLTWRRSGPAGPPPSTSHAAKACCSRTDLHCGVFHENHQGKSAGLWGGQRK